VSERVLLAQLSDVHVGGVAALRQAIAHVAAPARCAATICAPAAPLQRRAYDLPPAVTLR
jgi:hypothetical protein